MKRAALLLALVAACGGCASAPRILVCVHGHYIRDDRLVLPTLNCYEAHGGRVEPLERAE